MPTLTTPARLEPLIAYLSDLRGRATIERLRELLAESNVTLDDVHDFVEFDHERYRRNLLAIGAWFEILVICWRSGQRSPIHDHAASTCGLKILEGVCSETIFERAPCGQVVARRTQDMVTGQVCASQDADTHQVSNLQPDGEDLVTLHIYSPPLRSMKRFSITGNTVDEYRPQTFEFSGGDGI